jgi:hypothetical protein
LVNVLCLVVASAALAAPVTEQQEVEQQTAVLRGLKFQKPVTYKLMDRAKLREFLIEKAREQYPAGELRDLERTLVAMGLVPAGTDLLEVMLSMYDEQVAAFYDPDEQTLCTFKDATFSRNIDKMLLAHELTHALQDQHFDFRKFPLKVKDNDDRMLAAMAVIEGDATVLMTRWFVTNGNTQNMLEDLGAMMKQNTTKLLAAPPYLRETLLFPYLRGQEYAMRLDAEALNAAFRKLPASTEQILHAGNQDEPRDVKVPDFNQPGWRRIGNNVLGEFGIEVLLRESVGEFRAQLAATGWGGDRYHVYENGTNGPTGVLWATEWDTPRDAEEFEDVYREMLLKAKLPVKMETTIRRKDNRVTVRQSSEKEFFAP